MEEDKIYCIECSDEILEDERRRECDGEIYCMECFDQHHFNCQRCDEVFSRDDLHSADGLAFCESCYGEQYCNCSNCGDAVHFENVYQNNAGDDFCHCCYREHAPLMIHTWDYRPKWNFHTLDKTESLSGRELFLGFEIETKMPVASISDNAKFVLKHSDNENLFYLKDDSTIGGGFEMVSHPATLDFHKSIEYKKLFSDLIKRGCRSHNTETCGLHVHINRTFLSETDKIKMAMFVYSQKANIIKIARRDCIQWSKFKDIRNLVKKHLPLSNERYEALNFTNRSTIELRTFKGTLKYDTFIAALEFVDSTIKYLKTQSISYIGNATPQAQAGVWYDYIQYLLANKKRYSTLILYLKAKEIIFDKHIINNAAVDTDNEALILESEAI